MPTVADIMERDPVSVSPHDDVETVIVNTERPPGATAPTSPPLMTATLS